LVLTDFMQFASKLYSYEFEILRHKVIKWKNPRKKV
jgi:hypothetical protein